MKDLVKIIHEASSGLSRFASPGYQILYFYVRILVVPVLTDVSKEDEEGLWEDYKLDDNQVSDSALVATRNFVDSQVSLKTETSRHVGQPGGQKHLLLLPGLLPGRRCDLRAQCPQKQTDDLLLQHHAAQQWPRRKLMRP